MNDEQKYRVAGTMLDRMVADYRDDMAKWAEKGNEHAERHVDAATIAQHMEELAVAQPEVTGWILTVAIQRLGDGLR